MQVRFHCPACRRLLGAPADKVGRHVRCPKCGTSVVIPPATSDVKSDVKTVEGEEGLPPSSEKANQEKPATTKRHSKKPPVRLPEKRSEAIPSARDESTREPPPEVARSPAISPPPANPPPAAPTSPVSFKPKEVREILPTDAIWISRRMLYVQGLLIALVGIVGVLLGFFIGGRHGKLFRANDATDSISVNFGLKFKGGGDMLSPDDGAIVIVLPADQTPDPVDRLTEKNFAPDRGPPTAEELLALKKLGGAYAVSDKLGNATIIVARPGDYKVCYISRRAQRPPQSPLTSADIAFLSRFFQQPPNLLGDRKYHLATEPLDKDQKLVHDFGASGK